MCETRTADCVECDKSRGEAPSSPAAGGRSSSLDPSETSSHPLAAQSRCQYAFHARSWEERKAVIDALWESEDEGHRKRAHRMGWCGHTGRVYVSGDGGASVYPHRCRDRLCPACAAHRARGLRERTERVLAHADSVRFVTLTLKHSDMPLAASIRRIRDAFTKLRRGRFWQKHVTGGVYGLEVKQNPTTRHWHVHLHCLVEGEYIDQRTLSRSWESATGDSPIVDVRAVHSRKQAVRYIASYVTKGSSVAGWGQEAVREFADAMRGQRLLQTFGSLHGIPIDVADDEEEPSEAVCVLDLWSLCMHADAGHADTCLLIVALAQLDDRLSSLLDELLPAFCWEAWSIVADPLEIVKAWVAEPPPELPEIRPLAIQLHLWAA